MVEQSQPNAYDGFFNLQAGNSIEMLTQMYQGVFAATAIASRAFGHIKINVSVETQRIFIVVRLRWFARTDWIFLSRWLQRKRDRWLVDAERNCRKILPDGMKLTIYYEPKMVKK